MVMYDKMKFFLEINVLSINELCRRLTTVRVLLYSFECGVVVLQAVDLDVRKSVPYVMISGDGERFAVDENSGVVRTRQNLDFETQQSYTLVISTRGAPNESPYITTVEVTVTVSFKCCNFYHI